MTSRKPQPSSAERLSGGMYCEWVHYVCLDVCMYVCMYVCTYRCLYVVCMHACMYVCSVEQRLYRHRYVHIIRTHSFCSLVTDKSSHPYSGLNAGTTPNPRLAVAVSHRRSYCCSASQAGNPKQQAARPAKNAARPQQPYAPAAQSRSQQQVGFTGIIN